MVPELIRTVASLAMPVPASQIGASPGRFAARACTTGLVCLGGLIAPWVVPRAAATVPDFQRDIRPLLAARCSSCHNARERKGELDVSTAQSLAAGGENGAVVRPGAREESPLWQRVAAAEMPPEGPPLAAEQAQLLGDWIAGGAPGLPAADDAAPGEHWAFQPIERRPVPELAANDPLSRGVQNDIDRFIREQLAARGLEPNPPADRATLLRRVTFDLTGLPPTPEELAEFLADPDPQAYAVRVERLLTSPRHGQRWAKVWLDAAGYADSNGYFHADSPRPHAWRYRDYVVEALNRDVPFDQFLQQQLAGDELVGYVGEGDVTPEMVSALVATHLLRNAQDGTGESDGNDDEVHTDRCTVLEGTLEILGSSMLGLSLQCCRCHDHKFEPVTQAEYYALQALFVPALCPDQWRKPAERVIRVGSREERAAHDARVAELDAAKKHLEETLVELTRPVRRGVQQARLADVAAEEREALFAAIDRPEDERSEEDRQRLERYQQQLAVSDEELAAYDAGFGVRRGELQAELAAVEASRPAPLDELSILCDVALPPPAHHVLIRGQHRRLGAVVEPGVPAILNRADNRFMIEPQPASSGRRLALARWLTSPRHPLLARVTVNRLWLQYFGRGLVSTPENFGRTGEPPSHPGLLDYLAGEFMAHGWSQRWLHRLIVTSATYAQGSETSESQQRLDPDNVWLARMRLRRLDAEQLRDALLFVAGELDERAGGPFVPTVRAEDGSVAVPEEAAGAHRRAIYLQQRRTQVESLLEVFDAPLVVTNCTRRNQSTVPLQSLSLLNSPFMVGRAAALAARLAADEPADVERRLERAFQLTWGRPPRGEERAAARGFLGMGRGRDRRARGGAAGTEAVAQGILSGAEAVADGAADWGVSGTGYLTYGLEAAAQEAASNGGEADAWRDLCQMLLAANAFLYLE